MTLDSPREVQQAEAARRGLTTPQYKRRLRDAKRRSERARREHEREKADLGNEPPAAARQQSDVVGDRDDRLVLTDAGDHPTDMKDRYRGCRAFLVCSGPSLATLDLTPLDEPGVLTMAVNNAAKLHRPDLWTCVDQADHFLHSIWEDPTITKLAPWSRRNGEIYDSTDRQWTRRRPTHCPNTVFYKRHSSHFDPDTFLTEPRLCWGLAASEGGARSVMLAALRLLHHIGVTSVYLLGVDFHMEPQDSYAFDEHKDRRGARTNNNSYRTLNARMGELRPVFEREGFHVYNCNPESNLTAFDFIPYEQALEEVRRAWGGIDTANEPTAGHYRGNK